MNLHSHTPSLMVIDARGLSVRHVRFCRDDGLAAAESRLVRQVFDLAGRRVSSFDPRLDRPSTSTIHALSGAALLTDSVDAGWRVSLSGESGHVLEKWNSRGSRSSISHDALLRPVAVVEQLEGQAARTVERFTYGDASNESAAHNQCGQLLRRDDPAGSTAFLAFGLTRACLRQQRRFLLELDQPDWPDALSERDACLEVESHVSSSIVGPLGDVIESWDAQGHRQLRAFGSDGQLKHIGLKRANAELTQTLVSDIRYNALGVVEQESAGNGVVSTAVYDKGNGRLVRLLAQSGERTFQDLNYTYDPVGNVVSIEDAAQSTEHFSQQRTDPVNRYRYDSLYQLIEATGREVAAFSHGPHLPSFQTLPLNSGCLVNYTQRFDYDPGGNLIARHHSGTGTWRMATSTTSNRSVPQRADGSLPGDEQIAAGFDGNGNLIDLQPGQIMRWDARNQLSDITSVVRDDGPNDGELYRYDGDGLRVRKVRYTQTRSRTLTGDVRYLPGLEIHRNDATAEVRHVLTVEAGRCTVRVLHWDSGKPDEVVNDQLRYSFSDHLGSSTLEVDDAAHLISHEGYYPYGGTAWWVGGSAVEAKYKVVRYSGKERDATGLYYYGLRYYAPWLQRWVNPDPAGNVDGLNAFCFVKNNAVSLKDAQGLAPVNPVEESKGKGRWRLRELTLETTERSETDAREPSIGHNVKVSISLSYKPKVYDRLLNKFEEAPSLQWHEKIGMNDYASGERWKFEADMYQRNPTSRTLEVWPRKYIDAYDSAFSQSSLLRGEVLLKDQHGRRVGEKQLKPNLQDNREKAEAVRSFLQRKGGTLVITVHDVPALHLRDDLRRERSLDISVGIKGFTQRVGMSQYLQVDTTSKPWEMLAVHNGPRMKPAETLALVDPPILVSRPRERIFAAGEYP